MTVVRDVLLRPPASPVRGQARVDELGDLLAPGRVRRGQRNAALEVPPHLDRLVPDPFTRDQRPHVLHRATQRFRSTTQRRRRLIPRQLREKGEGRQEGIGRRAYFPQIAAEQRLERL